MYLNEFNQSVGEPLENWSPARFPSKSVEGKYCILEPMNPSAHAEALYQALQTNNLGESWTYLPYGPFASFQEFNAWLVNAITDRDSLFFAIMDAQTGRPMGCTAYSRINPDHGSIEIAHVHFSSLLKQSTAATEAIFLLMRNAFDALGYRRCEWKCHSLNAASRKAALRLGFQFEGIFRQDKVFKNRNRDTAWFSIIDSEWPMLRRKYEIWLDPSNFHEDGTQKQRLSEIICS